MESKKQRRPIFFCRACSHIFLFLIFNFSKDFVNWRHEGILAVHVRAFVRVKNVCVSDRERLEIWKSVCVRASVIVSE